MHSIAASRPRDVGQQRQGVPADQDLKRVALSDQLSERRYSHADCLTCCDLDEFLPGHSLTKKCLQTQDAFIANNGSVGRTPVLHWHDNRTEPIPFEIHVRYRLIRPGEHLLRCQFNRLEVW